MGLSRKKPCCKGKGEGIAEQDTSVSEANRASGIRTCSKEQHEVTSGGGFEQFFAFGFHIIALDACVAANNPFPLIHFIH